MPQPTPSIWTRRDAFATALLLQFLDTYGTEGLYWTPATISLELADDQPGDIPAINFDKLMAGIALLTTDRFYTRAEDFIRLCNVLSGSRAADTFDPADAQEIAWGVTEGLLINPPEDDEPFSQEVRTYIGVVLDREGLLEPPDVLRLGLRGASAIRPQHEFSDLPELLAAIRQAADEKTAAINGYIRNRLQQLCAQLQQLQLTNGNAAPAAAQLYRALTAAAQPTE